MKRSAVSAAALVALSLLLWAGHALAFPEPSPYPIAWQLDFKHAVPHRVVLTPPGSDIPQAFWYVTFSVTNNTDTDQDFLPEFTLLTEDGQPFRSDKNVPAAVFDKVKNVEGNRLLEPLFKVTGKLRIGAAQARDSVAIWPEPNPRMGTFNIFVSGLSGEKVTLKKVNGDLVPLARHEAPPADDARVVLVKTLQLEYQVPGDERAINPVAALKSETWIMR